MSDNPLGDWLRERHAALGASDPVEPGPPEEADPRGAWPAWGTQEAVSPGPVRWDHPPQGETGSPRRRRRLVLAATLPWLLAGGLGVVAVTTDPGGEQQQPALTTESDGRPAAPSQAVPAEADLGLGAAAASAVRLLVTTPGDSADENGERRYVDLAVPEAVGWLGGVAVVTVRAVVLEGPPDGWRSARPARYAVPTAWVGGRAVVLGEPWVLRGPDDGPSADGWQAAQADATGVVAAVTAAGYHEPEVSEVQAHPDHPGFLRATVLAQAPAESSVRRHDLWLHTEPDLAVLGANH